MRKFNPVHDRHADIRRRRSKAPSESAQALGPSGFHGFVSVEAERTGDEGPQRVFVFGDGILATCLSLLMLSYGTKHQTFLFDR
jgi:hypothetical protein